MSVRADAAGTAVWFDLQLKTVTPLHVGTGEEGSFADRPLRRTAKGKLVIPGTTIAGALRATAERLTGRRWEPKACRIVEGPPLRSGSGREDEECSCPICRLFGDVREGDASRVYVRDVVVTDPSSRWTAIRDGVGIDRDRGGASEGALFTTEVIPPNVQLDLELEARDASPWERGLLARCLEELAAGRIPLGLGRARGWGRVEGSGKGRVRVRDLNQADELVGAVARKGTAAWGDAEEDGIEKMASAFERSDAVGATGSRRAERSIAAARVQVSLSCDLKLPQGETLLVRDPMASALLARDAVQLGVTGPEPEPGDVVLPGSTVRGVLRSQAERILRTIGPNRICSPFEEGACLGGDSGRQGVCIACDLFGSTERASRLSVWGRPACGSVHVQPFDHVALDRFTGGAGKGLKFDAWAVASSSSEDPLRFPVRFGIDPMPFPERRSKTPAADGDEGCPPVRRDLRSELGLLILALRDIRDGLVGFGSGWAKGHGRLVPQNTQLVLETGDRATTEGLEVVAEALDLSEEPHDGETNSGWRWTLPLDLDPSDRTTGALVESLHERIREESAP